MCDECGCGQSVDSGDHTHDHGAPTRAVEIQRNVRAANDALATENRTWIRERKMEVVNLISSPGAGKTTLLERTLRELQGGDRPLAVVEGDQQTDNDARRIAATGVSVVQINTGSSCHLNAHQVGHALEDLDPPDGALVFVENVGNLICPAGFDLGQSADVTVLSVTEGDDKPEKYPEAFLKADAMVLSKFDLLPHLDFDVDRAERFARALNPTLPIFHLSAKTGEGLSAWLDWLANLPKTQTTRP
jgi:hydrogenase nickel incorporation protein HypB